MTIVRGERMSRFHERGRGFAAGVKITVEVLSLAWLVLGARIALAAPL